MPELAEVEHSRRIWDPGIGKLVREVIVRRPDGRIYRGTDVGLLERTLKGKRMLGSEARGKQMLFHFSGGAWLGLHLGMSGGLRCENAEAGEFAPRKHDHLILKMGKGIVLSFEDPRLFGRVRFDVGQGAPEWWQKLPPAVTSSKFTSAVMRAFLDRRAKAAIKGVLLMQERFPGVGNWMADEILWRAKIYPGTLAGEVSVDAFERLYREVRWVCTKSVEIMDEDWNYPASWLFSHRWEKGGSCPKCDSALDRGTIAGRTTAWCPVCQPGTPGTDGQDRKRKRTLSTSHGESTRAPMSKSKKTAPAKGRSRFKH